MTIALLTDGFYPFTMGGIQKHSYYLAKYWARQGIAVHVYHPNPYKAEVLNEHFTAEELERIHFVYVQHPQSIKFPGHYIYNSYRYSKALYKKVGNQKYDAIYAQGFTGWYFVKNQEDINLVTNLHGLNMFQASVNIKHKIQLLLLRIPAKPIILKSHKQISLGGKLTDILYKQGAQPNSVFEVPNAIAGEWIDFSPVSNAKPDKVKNLNKKRDYVKINKTRRFIFIGRYERLKGIEEINQVVEQLVQEGHRNFQIDFVGPIPENKRLDLGDNEKGIGYRAKDIGHREKDIGHREKDIGDSVKANTGNSNSHNPQPKPQTLNPKPYNPQPKPHNLNPIIYHGSITSQQTIQTLLHESDILLCPSYSEGMPTVILEAMACGCAIIATDVGASGELVNDQNGWLIKGNIANDLVSGLKNAMRQALSIEESSLQQMKEASMHKVKEKYTWDVVARQSLEVVRLIG
ncbi:Glycosyltransferase involved in cell wall bisynthesis [Saccharicrinis carchari]|uniref:Glycosyltransferase involved in cell wall bisynthesis n=1 Tax=Saccharicrinis carchari TaxID=1168039 RepID=A0A521AKH1_SACCC|nr:glycosyltransferase family 4 protein [Saccharicrinis carchari]SMO35306.1 Glycosyltransferase involved in cell wall bisynthesis [Saccharicrinis carchari]